MATVPHGECRAQMTNDPKSGTTIRAHLVALCGLDVHRHQVHKGAAGSLRSQILCCFKRKAGTPACCTTENQFSR